MPHKGFLPEQLTSDHEPVCMCHCIFFRINPRVSKYHAFSHHRATHINYSTLQNRHYDLCWFMLLCYGIAKYRIYLLYSCHFFQNSERSCTQDTPLCLAFFFCQREVDLKYPDSQMCHQSFNGLSPLPWFGLMKNFVKVSESFDSLSFFQIITSYGRSLSMCLRDLTVNSSPTQKWNWGILNPWL